MESTVGVEMAPERDPDSAHAREAYLPERERSGIGLCLSGGGSRAALFHLGVLRRLNELGVLSRVRTISCVSGGSILGAHVARAIPSWPAPGAVVPDFAATVVRPFEQVVRLNLRTAPLVRRFFLPWNLPRDQTQIQALRRLFERHVTDRNLTDLPAIGPQFIFCASDNAFAVNWIFSRDRVGDYQAGYAATPSDWKVATAVAASSCFPPLFDPLRLDVTDLHLTDGRYPVGAARDALIRGLRLSDGGLYDNLALEPVWKDHEVIIASDGGATFDPSADAGLLWRIKRYASVMGRQSSAVRKRWLIAGYLTGVFRGVYMGIGTPASRYATDAVGYPAELVDDTISEVRTDLDAFSDAEIGVLQNHGYLIAEAGIRRHLSDRDVPLLPAPAAVPYPQYMDAAVVARELADSSRVKLPFGRGDWFRELF
jgi:NTE family protein